MTTINSEWVLPPGAIGGVSTVSVSGTASAAAAVGPGHYTFYSDGTQSHILFGDESDMSAPTTSTGAPIPAGEERSYYVPRAMYFEVIDDGTTGTLYYYKSGA